MEAIRFIVLKLWSNTLLIHRTMMIKAESKRRKAIASTQDRNNSRNAAMLYNQTQTESHRDSHSITIADVFSTAVAPSTMLNCDPLEMKRVFDLFDENKDGLISAEELQQFMKRLGFELSDQNVKDMVETVDKNNDECVDFDEFFSLHKSLCEAGGDNIVREDSNNHHPSTVREDDHEEGTLLKAFFVFDENKDGLISALELQQVLLKLGLPEGRSLMGCQKMIEKVDTDGNGKVDFFEFKDMMCSNAFSFCRS